MEEEQKTDENAMETTKDVLQKWNDFYINNDFGIGVQCDKCKKWREVFQYQDRSEVPDVWICSMWQIDSKRRGTCRMPSKLTENDFAESQFAPGDLVWAKMNGFPRWPGMIEDCPDTQDYFMPYEDSEHEYHVNFFGSKPQRSWIKASGIYDFSSLGLPKVSTKAKKSMLKAVEQANEAMTLSIKERLLKFSFAVRYKGRWGKITKDEVVMPPSELVKKKSTGCRSRLVHAKPDANQDCTQASLICKKENEPELEVDIKQNSKNDSEFQPARNQDEKIKNNNSSANQSADISESEDEEKEQLSAKRKKQLSKSEEKGESSAKRVKKSVKSKQQCTPKKRCLVSTTNKQKNATKGSDQSLAKKRIKLVESISESDTDEDSQSNKEADKAKTEISIITDKSSAIHIGSEVSSDCENEFITPAHRAYREFLDKNYPPLIFDVDNVSSSDTEVCNKYSDGNSDSDTNLENTNTFPKNKPVSKDEDESISNDEPVTYAKNKTIASDNEQDFDNQNESTSSVEELVMNVENETTFSKIKDPVFQIEDESTSTADEPVINGEKETNFPGNMVTVIQVSDESTSTADELVMNEENETTFSENKESVIQEKEESTSSDDVLVINEEKETAFSGKRELVIEEENATYFSGNWEPVFKEEIASTFYKKDSNISSPAYYHASYLPYPTTKTQL